MLKSAFGKKAGFFWLRIGGIMLQIKNLKITHKKDDRGLIDGLSFTLNSGDKMAIIGEEGNGRCYFCEIWRAG